MALKDFLSLADDKLHDIFSKKAYDPARDRAAMIKRLDTAHNQYQSATPTKGKKMFSIANGVVELNLPISIGGKSRFLIPTERFGDAISHLKAAIGAGEADKELEAGKTGTVESAPKAPRKPRDPNAPKTEKAGWSDERRQRFDASIAARKSSKAA